MSGSADEIPAHPGYVDPALVPLCAELTAHAAEFEAELARLGDDDFVPWFDVGVYSGGWLVFPLIAALEPLPAGFDLARTRALCPTTHSILAAHPRILLAGFSRLMPGACVRPHSDHPGAGVLRFHLRLGSAQRSALEFDGVPAVFRPRTGILFDHSMVHASHNHGASARDVLLVDILLAPEEIEAVVRARGAVHRGSHRGHAR